MPARPFHRTGILARRTGAVFASGETARRALRWLALRGSPPGRRDRPDMRVASNPVSAEDQVQDQNQQQKPADPDAASVPVSAITEAAPKQEQDNQDDQN